MRFVEDNIMHREFEKLKKVSEQSLEEIKKEDVGIDLSSNKKSCSNTEHKICEESFQFSS